MKIKIIKDKNFDFKDKKVLIMGLGLNGGGLGIAKFLYNQGAKITITDLKDKKYLKESLEKLKNLKDIKYILGQHKEEDFIENDVIIKGAGIKWNNKFINIALKNGKYVDTAAGIFFEFSENKKIGITGSKGKSTTTTLIYEIFKNTYKDVKIAGNISRSFFEEFEKNDKNSIYVLELSSWQLNDISIHEKSPEIAIITTLLPDHLNYYKTMENYIEDKKKIYKFQNKNDYLILNIDNEYIRKYILNDNIVSQIIFVTGFYEKNILEKIKTGYFDKIINQYHKNIKFFIGFDNNEFYLFNRADKFDAKNELSIFKNNDLDFSNYFKLENYNIYKLFEMQNLFIKGIHNLYNISLAVTVSIIENIPLLKIKEIIEKFKGVRYRNEFIGKINSIEFYNDTTATVPDAVAATLSAFDKKVILIAGGMDKNLSLKNMVNAIINNVKQLILLEGDGSEKLLTLLSREGYKNIDYYYNDLFEAVKKAYDIAKSKDIILLSPGFASFNMFKNEFERGEIFNLSFEKIKRMSI